MLKLTRLIREKVKQTIIMTTPITIPQLSSGPTRPLCNGGTEGHDHPPKAKKINLVFRATVLKTLGWVGSVFFF